MIAEIYCRSGFVVMMMVKMMTVVVMMMGKMTGESNGDLCGSFPIITITLVLVLGKQTVIKPTLFLLFNTEPN